jgi:hypothetical protein
MIMRSILIHERSAIQSETQMILLLRSRSSSAFRKKKDETRNKKHVQDTGEFIYLSREFIFRRLAPLA